ncbi:hypothetical protein Pcinc_021579 [Petrolisthes cinctipes]|uniref:Uncharacterized protein n=1 Tax=Petrolisthes cinctipes TaxID=88211 RepID=A0AAE1FG81_PETCI|nr:hypothetical protein Pcinc_021579 [Petrolisthes cinctipes]
MGKVNMLARAPDKAPSRPLCPTSPLCLPQLYTRPDTDYHHADTLALCWLGNGTPGWQATWQVATQARWETFTDARKLCDRDPENYKDTRPPPGQGKELLHEFQVTIPTREDQSVGKLAVLEG